MMTSSGIHGRLLLKNACQIYVIRRRLLGLRHAGARIHLYRYLDELKVDTLYCDTDSDIFIQPRDETGMIETGDNRGDMTSELKPHEYISEIMFGGPKIYAYKVINTKNVSNQSKTICKFRGLTLNYNASHFVNFNASET